MLNELRLIRAELYSASSRFMYPHFPFYEGADRGMQDCILATNFHR